MSIRRILIAISVLCFAAGSIGCEETKPFRRKKAEIEPRLEAEDATNEFKNDVPKGFFSGGKALGVSSRAREIESHFGIH